MKTPLPFALCALPFQRLLVFSLAMMLSACASDAPVTTLPGDADKLLIERGQTSLKEGKWTTARQYFSELLESYPQSPLRAEAKLGVGDSFLGENNSASYVYALNEYREFLAFYPTNPRADYAQLQLAMVHFRQMLGPQRDQTETKAAIQELQTFVQRYPNSSLLPEAKARLREATDRLSDSEFAVGMSYLRMQHFSGAENRFKPLLQHDPEYTRKDAVYFYLAEALEKSDRKAEALPYYERLIREYERSEHLGEAKRRIERLKASVPPGQ